jgi:hypothetical protein
MGNGNGLIDWRDLGEKGIEALIEGGVNYAVGQATKQDPKDIGEAYGEISAESYKEIMAAIREEMQPMLQKELAMQQEFDPQQRRLAWEGLVGSKGTDKLAEGFVPGVTDYALLGGRVDDITRSLAAGTDKDIMTLQGPYMAENVMDQLAITDQPWLNTRDAGALKVQELLNSINMSGLSGGERAEIERMNARRNLQRGQAGGGGNLTGIENAMQFGSALDRKRAALGNALQTATNFMAGSRSGYDPVQATLGRGSGTNQIAAGFQGVQPVKDYSGQVPGLPSNIMEGVTPGGFLNTVKQGAQWKHDWLNPGK